MAAAASRLPGTVLLWLGSCLPAFVSLILFDVLPLNFSAASECQVLFFFFPYVVYYDLVLTDSSFSLAP